MIQRDYAQGRENESEVRTRFLDAIFDSLTEEKDLDLGMRRTIVSRCFGCRLDSMFEN